jgi:preprotein translocase subunit YajC
MEGIKMTYLAQQGGAGNAFFIIYMIVIIAVFYFLLIRPQKKQQKEMDALRSSLKSGDSVLTSSGFYGVILDVMDDTVIVEFGNNKNCRIPMQKSAIVQVEHAASEATETE